MQQASQRLVEVGRDPSGPAPCSGRAPRTTSKQLLKISKEDDSRISLGNLFECYTTC